MVPRLPPAPSAASRRGTLRALWTPEVPQASPEELAAHSVVADMRRKSKRRLQYGTFTLALPRSAKTSLSNCCRCRTVSTGGRPPALESSPCHDGSARCLANTASTARTVGRLPSFFRTRLAISGRVAPAACIPQMASRVNGAHARRAPHGSQCGAR